MRQYFDFYTLYISVIIHYILKISAALKTNDYKNKGCRGAQCGWIQLNEAVTTTNQDINISVNATANKSNQSKHTSFSLPWTLKNTLLLIIYIAPRGILEIYHLSIKHRLGALLFHPNGKLLYHLSLFEQAKNNYGDPSHIFICDYHKKQQSVTSSTFSLASFKTATVDDIDLDNFEEEDIKFDGTMYELKLKIIDNEMKSQPKEDKNAWINKTLNGFLSPPNQLSPSKSTGSATSSTTRYSPITFIHPTMSTKVS